MNTVGDRAYSIEVALWVGEKLLAAAGGTEIVGGAGMLSLVFGRRRINRHAAHGVLG
jgi:hypothetical protein